MGAAGVTLVLLHGAGDSARVWTRTRSFLRHRSVAVDLLGRGSRPADITKVTLAAAAGAAAADVRGAEVGPYLVVAHSAAGMVAPGLVGQLGAEARGLVLIAGVTAPHDQAAVDVMFPGQRADFARRREAVLARYANHAYVTSATDPAALDGLVGLEDPKIAMAIDSLNLLFQPVSWTGVGPGVSRTCIRPTGDEIQAPDLQDRLIAAAGAARVITIESGHTPARSAPRVLAGLLDDLADGHQSSIGT